MENELFMNTGVPEMTSPSSSSAMLNWASMATQQVVDPTSLSRNPSRDCFFWEKSTEESIFDSALSSLVSSPTPSNSHFSGGVGGGGGGGDNNFIIRELIGKLGNIGNTSGEIYGNFSGTPMSSPPPRSMMTTKPTTPLAEFSGDPGFAERAARFSCFGSRSFNGRTNSPFPINNNNNNNGHVTATATTNGKLTRVSSSPALNALATKIPGGESPGETSRKRKAKAKENSPSTASPSPKEEDSDPKRSKKSEENEEKAKAHDPHKDFIHVRARRGQATDSHSLAERVRREKISERMKLLQDLVPGCNKVTGKALMLDEIINYVQSLQRQVEFLSMKLSSVNTRLEFNMDTLVSKDMFLSTNNPMHQQILQLESSAQTLLADHHNKTLQLNPNIMDPLDSISQYSSFSEDDLHSIVHMGFAQNQFHGLNPIQGPSNQVQSSHMKDEL